MSQLAQSLRLNLPDSLSRCGECLGNLVEVMFGSVF
jgi:hypothetical protein